MEDCCLSLIATYLRIVGGAREGAALYCKHCHSRMVYRSGVWTTEGGH